jgi:hypothetical protein
MSEITLDTSQLKELIKTAIIELLQEQKEVLTDLEVFVDSDSIKSSMGNVQFRYKIGNETIAANADCNGKRWYASGYGWYSPASQATQKMLDYVCSF